MKRNQRCVWTIAFGGALWGVLEAGCSSLPVDPDGDGYSEPEDCDNQDATQHPDALEQCNGEDDNCNGEVDEGLECESSPTPCIDADVDGACAALDCDEGDPNVHPGATESCNGIDNDCDGTVPTCWGQAEWGVWSWLKTLVGDLVK